MLRNVYLVESETTFNGKPREKKKLSQSPTRKSNYIWGILHPFRVW
jgi:hypothetical protein